jgi:hypothetical protein
VWRTGSGLTNRWVQATGTIPNDFANSLSLKARMKVAAGGSTQNLQNWQLYLGVFNDGDSEVWNIAGPDTFGSLSLGTTWQTITLKNVSMPTAHGVNSYVACAWGIGANSITTTSDIYLGDLYFEYVATY